ncbi:MAG: hypothetical protein HDR83_06010 [Bacteroides sp.]|nr:hypothetical protein [Bacteroidales bacterium]MBD5253544.1 hypothetical protein [Barnesiella sp.]MBD5368795.1 hypothetical protein [Bacteroides sp.]
MDYSSYDIHPVVLGYDEIVALAPQLKGKRRLVEGLIHFLSIDKCNDMHSRLCDTPGPDFCRRMLDELDIKLKIDNAELLDHLPEGPFVTVSNHPFGALDGVTLIDLIGSRRPEFKVMVNMTLNYISALRPSFIAVDSLASDDPVKKAVSVRGIKEAMSRIRNGHPVGFFPAGAVAKLNGHLRLEDREWQPTVIRLIKKMNVPVIPIYFHGSNSWWFNFLGIVSWQLRTLRLPAEIFKKAHKTIHISIGNPISVEEQNAHSGSLEELGLFLREKTFELRDR